MRQLVKSRTFESDSPKEVFRKAYSQARYWNRIYEKPVSFRIYQDVDRGSEYLNRKQYKRYTIYTDGVVITD